MPEQFCDRHQRVRRSSAAVLIAIVAGLAAATYPTAGGASPVAAEPTGSAEVNESTSTAAVTSTTASSTTTTASTTTSTVPTGSCVDSSGQTVGTLPGQTSCPDPLPTGPCRAVDPAECAVVPTVRGLSAAAGSSGAAAAGSAALKFTG